MIVYGEGRGKRSVSGEVLAVMVSERVGREGEGGEMRCRSARLAVFEEEEGKEIVGKGRCAMRRLNPLFCTANTIQSGPHRPLRRDSPTCVYSADVAQSPRIQTSLIGHGSEPSS